MAQAGYTPIQLYYSITASATPSAGNLLAGELALNTTDEKLYFKNASGTVKLLASNAATSSDVTQAGNNAFTGANTFYNSTGQTFGTGTSTQDGLILAGRAGGSSSYRVTLTPTTLTASRTLTLPNVTDTVATIGTAQTFTAAQTFRAASAVRSEAASTQDAVVLAGRAGGTSSYAVTLTPTTLSANRTITLADGDVTMVAGTTAVLGTAQTFTAAQTFRASNAIRSEAASTQDAIVLAGRAGGTSSYAVTLTPATLSASRTVTLPDGGGNYTLGYINLPAVGTKTGSYTLAVGDVGKYVQLGSGGSITIPTSTFAEGDAISLFNNTTGNITITCSAPTTYIAGTDSIKTSLTLATRGVATILFYSATACVVSGNVS